MTKSPARNKVSDFLSKSAKPLVAFGVTMTRRIAINKKNIANLNQARKTAFLAKRIATKTTARANKKSKIKTPIELKVCVI
jgi:hypothetical protein